jgi:uncharacterized membrane protein YsdA (DUF1294 family)
MEKYFCGYLLLINIYTFYLTYLDKYRAKHRKWRVPEKNFFILSILGGSIGTLISMKLFRHKTRHWYFKYGIPLIIVIQIIILYCIIYGNKVKNI